MQSKRQNINTEITYQTWTKLLWFWRTDVHSYGVKEMQGPNHTSQAGVKDQPLSIRRIWLYSDSQTSLWPTWLLS